MNLNLISRVNEWFKHSGDEIEFARCDRADPFYVVGPSQAQSDPIYLYATKPASVLSVRKQYPEFDAIAVICRTALPIVDDMEWVRNLLRNRELLFLGDMDPVDLLIFTWLRAYLDETHVAYLGISDQYLDKLGVALPESFTISCAPSEQKSLSFLEEVLPDFRELVGPVCTRWLDSGRKIELEGVASYLGPPGRLLLPAMG